MREGSEEYLDSEKYETKKRKLDGPLLPLVKTLNTIRRENIALQRLEGVDFLETENEHLIAYVRRALGNVVIVVVNLDPRSAQEGASPSSRSRSGFRRPTRRTSCSAE